MMGTNDKENPIRERTYIVLKLKLASPLIISGGWDENTDMDIMRNSAGEVFLPGTSIAGAMRNFLGKNKDQDSIMGFSRQKDGRMSALFLEDAYFDQSVSVYVRDGVRIKDEEPDERTVDGEGKYDYEIIETGAELDIQMEYIRREKDQADGIEELRHIISAIQAGEIRFGAKKTRGFGKMEVRAVYKACFCAKNREAWLEFKSDHSRIPEDSEHRWDNWEVSDKSARDLIITVPLRQKGGIIIRAYADGTTDADFNCTHLTCNRKPVIPGTSWNGVIRSRCRQILKELAAGNETYHKNAEYMIQQWFGYVDGKKARKSLVTIEESLIEKEVMLPVTRNRINRFDASTKNGALYTEQACFDGDTRLILRIQKDENRDWKALAVLLVYVIREIQEGYVSVGGEGGIGRGIFRKTEKISFSEEFGFEEGEAYLVQCLRKESKDED